MSTKYYFLFGEEITRIYESCTLIQVKESLKTTGCLHVYNEEIDQPSDLLSQYTGWEGFAEIQEHEYKFLNA
jgi:hypothetical protein